MMLTFVNLLMHICTYFEMHSLVVVLTYLSFILTLNVFLAAIADLYVTMSVGRSVGLQRVSTL